MTAGHWGVNTPAPSSLDETTRRCPQAPFKMEPKLPSRDCVKLDPYLTSFSVPLHYGFLLGAFPGKPLSWKSLALGLFLGNLTQDNPQPFCLAPLFHHWRLMALLVGYSWRQRLSQTSTWMQILQSRNGVFLLSAISSELRTGPGTSELLNEWVLFPLSPSSL